LWGKQTDNNRNKEIQKKNSSRKLADYPTTAVARMAKVGLSIAMAGVGVDCRVALGPQF
jgi:hypothetical protein